jgi:hypothetical protein
VRFKLIIVVAMPRVMKIYVAIMEALKKRKYMMKFNLPQKLIVF